MSIQPWILKLYCFWLVNKKANAVAGRKVEASIWACRDGREYQKSQILNPPQDIRQWIEQKVHNMLQLNWADATSHSHIRKWIPVQRPLLVISPLGFSRSKTASRVNTLVHSFTWDPKFPESSRSQSKSQPLTMTDQHNEAGRSEQSITDQKTIGSCEKKSSAGKVRAPLIYHSPCTMQPLTRHA